jgi:hypothetical protein
MPLVCFHGDCPLERMLPRGMAIHKSRRSGPQGLAQHGRPRPASRGLDEDDTLPATRHARPQAVPAVLVGHVVLFRQLGQESSEWLGGHAEFRGEERGRHI